MADMRITKWLNLKRPIAWVLYPVLIYWPYYLIIHKVLDNGIISPSVDEDMRIMWLNTFIVFTYGPLAILSIFIGAFLKLRYNLPSRDLKFLKKFIKVPDSITFLRFTTGQGKGGTLIKAILSCDDIQSIYTDSDLKPYMDDLPIWCEKYFKSKTSGLEYCETGIFSKQRFYKAKVIKVNEEYLYIEIDVPWADFEE